MGWQYHSELVSSIFSQFFLKDRFDRKSDPNYPQLQLSWNFECFGLPVLMDNDFQVNLGGVLPEGLHNGASEISEIEGG